MKKIVGVIVCMLVFFSAFPLAVSSVLSDGNTIYVDDDAPPEWYDETHVRTIQEGIDVASDGDTIFIYNGVYQPSTNIHVYKEVSIIGESSGGSSKPSFPSTSMDVTAWLAVIISPSLTTWVTIM